MANTPIAVIDDTGVFAPSYTDVLAYFQDGVRAIYGQDLYLEADSQDGQMLAVVARALHDANDAVIDTYNSFSPQTAQGAALASVVKVNGLRKLVATFSTVPIRVVGVAGATITAGKVGDDQDLGTVWVLPDFTFPPSGELTVTARSVTAGAVRADSITKILTPDPSWQSASNTTTVTVGDPVETDAALRRRQAKSTSLAAQSTVAAVEAALGNLPGAGRVRVYENKTGLTDSNGIPAHSIAAVVEGADVSSIVQTIAQKKTPGTGTFGSVYSTYIDARGVGSTIGYFPLSTPGVRVRVYLTPLDGYLSTTGNAVAAAVADEINALGIGTPIYISKLYTAANLYGVPLNNTYNVREIAVSLVPFSFNTPGYGFNEGSWEQNFTSADLPVRFFQAASCQVGNVEIILG